MAKRRVHPGRRRHGICKACYPRIDSIFFAPKSLAKQLWIRGIHWESSLTHPSVTDVRDAFVDIFAEDNMLQADINVTTPSRTRIVIQFTKPPCLYESSKTAELVLGERCGGFDLRGKDIYSATLFHIDFLNISEEDLTTEELRIYNRSLMKERFSHLIEAD